MRRRANLVIVCIFIALISPTFLIFNSNTAVSGETVGGYHITTDTTWSLNNSPYYIEGDVYVDYGSTLTIEAGVTVLFNGFYGVYVDGNLTAVGEPDYEIKLTSNFTTPYPEAWNKLQINSTGSAKIKYCEISYPRYSIFLNKSKDANIQSNSLTDSYAGIHLYYSSGNIIQNNDIKDNTRGIYLYFSDFNSMRYNRIYSSKNDGITLLHSSFNEMSNNNISQSGGYGIRLTSSPQNRIFHNNLIENVYQAFDDDVFNDWDDGYPSGGNYWSDYTGEDVNKSAGQDIPGSDGIGDTNYSIDSDTIDHYPLMNQTVDTAPILINLLSPSNRSVIKAGTIIDLEINIPPTDIEHVNYTKDGVDYVPINPPDYDINTTGWSEGYTRIDVNVLDVNGFVNSSWFYFTFDSTKPKFQLNSPLNNSLLRAGEIIDFTISEPHLKYVRYYKNGTLQGSLPYPHDIETLLWPDGIYTIIILAEDTAGNINFSWYAFTVDSTPPLIRLNSPDNGSYNKPGVLINLSISDEHMFSANYSLNDGPNQSFANQYTINTSLFEDGNFSLTVYAEDELGNLEFRFYEFVIDSISPEVSLTSPLNNSIIRGGVPLNFSVVESSPFFFRYSLNFQREQALYSPYNINTSDWPDNTYNISVNVTDYAGNFNTSRYNITIDSTEPKIALLSPVNNTIIRPQIGIVFEISDPHLLFARYSVNGGEYQNFTPQSMINTTHWLDGTYEIAVSAGDSVGNNISRSFAFRIDGTHPTVVETRPGDGDYGIAADTSIRVSFSEEMNPDSLLKSVSILPSINFTLSLTLDNLTLVIAPDFNLENSTRYTVVINSSASDLAGNTLGEDYVFSFTTGQRQGEDFTWLIVLSVLAILIGIILLAWLIYTRKRRASEDDEEEDEFEIKEKGVLDEDDVETELLGEEAEEEASVKTEEGEAGPEAVKELEELMEGFEGKAKGEAAVGLEGPGKEPKKTQKKIKIRVVRRDK